ncbi:MAG: inositol 2-dehydrogenase [Phototrophicales bacterium]|nr:MAG: inositol 2-dehydrogenase [Phototrophicales bacterium]
MTINIGVIGAGRIGKLHTENLVMRVPDATVLMVADVIEDAAKDLAARLNIPQATSDHHDILNNPDIDAVVICSATATHAPIMTEAAQARKHIFCEKPIDLSLDKIDAALAAVDEAGVKLQIGFNRRFDVNARAIREAIVSGRIGAPHILQITSRDPAPPSEDYVKVSGGIFLDMTIHDFDMARFLIDSPLVEVFATGSVRIDPMFERANDFDTAVITLRFEDGTIAVINNSRQAVYGYDQTIEVFGSKGAIHSQNMTPNRTVISDADGVHHQKPLYFFLERYNDSFIAEMNAFIDAIANDKATPVTGIDGRAPVVIGLAATKSAYENRPVKLSEIG